MSASLDSLVLPILWSGREEKLPYKKFAGSEYLVMERIPCDNGDKGVKGNIEMVLRSFASSTKHPQRYSALV